MEQERDWRDPGWSRVATAQAPLDQETRQQRRTLFGKNEIDIEGKSSIALLVDEVRVLFSSYGILLNELL